MEFFYWMKAYLPDFFCRPWFLFQIVAEEHAHCPLPLLRELFVVVTQANDVTITRVYRALTSVSQLQVDRVVEHLSVASLEKVAPLPRGEWNCLRDRATKYDWLALVSLTGKRKSEKEEFVVSMELLLDKNWISTNYLHEPMGPPYHPSYANHVLLVTKSFYWICLNPVKTLDN